MKIRSQFCFRLSISPEKYGENVKLDVYEKPLYVHENDY